MSDWSVVPQVVQIVFIVREYSARSAVGGDAMPA